MNPIEEYEIQLWGKEKRLAMLVYVRGVGAEIVAESVCGEWCYYKILANCVQAQAVNELLSARFK